MPVGPKAAQDWLFDETTSKSTRLSKYPGQTGSYNIVNSHSLSAAHRLLRQDGFDRVLKAENVAEKHYKIFFVHNYKGMGRLGIIASKKIFPRAVDRNRIKRAIREVFRQHSIKAAQLDIVVMVRLASSKVPGVPGSNLKILFDRVENKCAEL